MKNYGIFLISMTLLLSVVLNGYFYYENERVIEINQELQQQLAEQQKQLELAQNEVATLKKSTIEGFLEETNEAAKSTWKSLKEAFGEELEKAKELLKKPESESQLEPPSVPQDGEKT